MRSPWKELKAGSGEKKGVGPKGKKRREFKGKMGR